MQPGLLRDLPLSFRLGLSLLLLVLLGGLGAAGLHLVHHHENRDERPGLSLDDLAGAYHGLRTTAPLAAALRAGHPEDLPEAERALLLAWLASDRISEGYDSLEAGEMAPAEVIGRRCLSCHARQAQAGGGIGRRVPLEYWDDVRSVAFSRDVEPVPARILVASLHTHALTMAVLTTVLAVLGMVSRWPGSLVGAMAALAGLGLVLDFAGWFLARDTVEFVTVLAAGGAAWMGANVLLLLLVLADLWLPQRRS